MRLSCGGGVDRAHDVTQLHFLDLAAERAGERALRRRCRVLLDDGALRIEHERGTLTHVHAAAAQGEEEDQQQEQEDEVEYQAAREIDEVPQADEKADR